MRHICLTEAQFEGPLMSQHLTRQEELMLTCVQECHLARYRTCMFACHCLFYLLVVLLYVLWPCIVASLTYHFHVASLRCVHKMILFLVAPLSCSWMCASPRWRRGPLSQRVTTNHMHLWFLQWREGEGGGRM